jgi:hypothetical protein
MTSISAPRAIRFDCGAAGSLAARCSPVVGVTARQLTTLQRDARGKRRHEALDIRRPAARRCSPWTTAGS